MVPPLNNEQGIHLLLKNKYYFFFIVFLSTIILTALFLLLTTYEHKTTAMQSRILLMLHRHDLIFISDSYNNKVIKHPNFVYLVHLHVKDGCLEFLKRYTKVFTSGSNSVIFIFCSNVLIKNKMFNNCSLRSRYIWLMEATVPGFKSSVLDFFCMHE